MNKEAMKLALEALEETRNALAWFYDSYPQDVTKKGNELLPHVETVLTALREALAEQPAQQEQNRQIDQLIHERDHRDEIIDKLCDAVLGPDRYEWGSQYFFEDAVREVEERMAEQPAQQEPVAWRTFDGEGGYEYRTYEMNESYADEWNKRNPKHKGWVEPLYTTPQAQPAQRKPLTDDEFISMVDSAGIAIDPGLAFEIKEMVEAAHGIK